MKGKVIIFWLFVLVVMTGCMATRFANVWKDESYHGIARNVLVIAIVQSPERRKMVEDEMAKQLKTHGVNTVLGYAEFPDRLPGREEVISRLGKLGADAVLVTKFMERQHTTHTGFSDDYETALKQWEEPNPNAAGYYTGPLSYEMEPQDYAVMLTNLYDAETGKMVWSSLSKTWIVGTDSRLVSSFVSTVLKQLSDDKFIR